MITDAREREWAISEIGGQLLETRTMLFKVELFNTVASVVVLTENALLLDFVKGGFVVPGSGGLGVGSTIANLALQNVDCTRNDGRGCVRNGSHKVASSARYLRRQHQKRRRKLWLQRWKALQRMGFCSKREKAGSCWENGVVNGGEVRRGLRRPFERNHGGFI